MRRLRVALVTGLAMCPLLGPEVDPACAATAAARPSTPQAAVDSLLDADRAFAKAAAETDLVTGLSAIFAEGATMPLPTGNFAEGKAAVVEALRANPDNAKSRIEWAPVRGGVSADGDHGFTFGYMTLHKPDGTTAPLKYLAYWVREAGGWRVAVYKRGRAEGAPTTHAAMAPALPPAIVAPSTDAAAVEAFRASLDAAERAFSDEAQVIGLGPAFARWGSADAVNMGGPAPEFVLGAEAISQAVAAPPAPGEKVEGSPVSWAPDRTIVASSGDLGVTIGVIRTNEPPPEGQPGAFPFFTIWRRPTPDAPWRYVAE